MACYIFSRMMGEEFIGSRYSSPSLLGGDFYYLIYLWFEVIKNFEIEEFRRIYISYKIYHPMA